MLSRLVDTVIVSDAILGLLVPMILIADIQPADVDRSLGVVELLSDGHSSIPAG